MILLTDDFRPVPRRVLVEPWVVDCEDTMLTTIWYGWNPRVDAGAPPWQPGYILQRVAGGRRVLKLTAPQQNAKVHIRTVREWRDRARQVGPLLPNLAAVEMYLRHLECAT